jgi:hypothetical protein
MALKYQVTDAGRAALVNAANTGTLPVLVSQIGVTATAFTAAADGSNLALPGELKRLVTFGGSAVADDTIHVVIRDDSTDTYTLRGFGLYLADGTLFGLYGQADPILEKSAGAMMLLATDCIFADIDAASLVFGNTDFLNPPATVDVQGVVELATDAEAITGTDPVRALTPKSLLAALNARFGAGNPSAFVKTLLDKVSELAFVTALGIRGAASFDTGTGNGLDADLLDGQHGAYYRSYANLTDVPATFAPAPHTHSAGDITSGVLGVIRGGTGAATFAAGSYVVGNGIGAFVVKTPAQVLADIGAAAALHSHEIAAVNGLQTALDARPLQTSVTSQISVAVNALINGSPGALDTLKELADAMGDDPNFAATVTNALALKAPLNNPPFTGNATFAGNTTVASTGNLIANRNDGTWVLCANNASGSASRGGLWVNATNIGLVNVRSGFQSFMLNDDGTLSWSGGYATFASSASFAGSVGVGTNPASVPGIGNPVRGANNIIGYNAGDIGLTLLTDNAAARTSQIGFGSAGIGVFDAGMQYNNSTRALSLISSVPVSLVALAASGAITGASVRATGTIMAAGGFQVG